MTITQTSESQSDITPSQAIEMLKEGNARFTSSAPASRDYQSQVADTAGGQYPFAAVVSCIDSRIPTEIVFDQGINPLSPPLRSPQQRPQGHPAKSKFLAVDGMTFGSRGFVEKVFMGSRDRFGEKRKTGARPLRGVGWQKKQTRLYSMRQLGKDFLG
mgnify:CR=1 FL=1